MKSNKEVNAEAASEKESPAEEKGEYQHIDEFVASLDKEELAYLKGCLKKHSMMTEDSDTSEKEYSEKDFEKE